jgi:hypothetical protein
VRAFFGAEEQKKVVLPDESRRRLGPGCPVIARAESAFYLFPSEDEEAQLGQFGAQSAAGFGVGFRSCGQNRHN